jgi:hypothetical protein
VRDPTLDAIVVAYAFRDHWMWFNGYSYQGRTFSFVIWKDYNCVTWNSVDDTAMKAVPFNNIGLAFASTFLDVKNTLLDPYNDIWTAG